MNALSTDTPAQAPVRLTWRQPLMAVLVVLLFGPIFAAPLEAMTWAAAGMLHLGAAMLHGAEAVALAVALIPTVWLAARGWRAESRMLAGLDP